VLLNLLTNGIKYTPEPGNVTVSYYKSASDMIRICVSDTGPGIPEEKLPHLFTPFERLGAEHSQVEGTGLGLALSKRLTEAMRGSMGLKTSVGKGSTFWVELTETTSPAEQAQRQNGGILAEAHKDEPLPRKILYVEDNLSNLTLVEQMLEEHKQIQLLSAMQGKLGLDLARQHLPDLVLLDLHLPDLPGWDVLAQLKAQPSTRHIPVVVVSADATASQIRRLMAAGATSYLTKPLNVGEFFRVLGETCEKSRSSAGKRKKLIEVIS
jgi:CheY-like chemotaxis protein